MKNLVFIVLILLAVPTFAYFLRASKTKAGKPNALPPKIIAA